VPVEFILFGIMLLGVAVLHRWPMAVALTGLSAIVIYELFVSGFPSGGHGLGRVLINGRRRSTSHVRKGSKCRTR
jgi:hypothetical protein